MPVRWVKYTPTLHNSLLSIWFSVSLRTRGWSLRVSLQHTIWTDMPQVDPVTRCATTRSLLDLIGCSETRSTGAERVLNTRLKCGCFLCITSWSPECSGFQLDLWYTTFNSRPWLQHVVEKVVHLLYHQRARLQKNTVESGHLVRPILFAGATLANLQQEQQGGWQRDSWKDA